MRFNHNYWKYKLDPKVLRCIRMMENWSSRNHATFGISGSFANGGFRRGSDLDIVLIWETDNDSDRIMDLAPPREFCDESWQSFASLLKNESAHVFGSWSSISDLIRLEVYPMSVVKRILTLEEFVIKRLRMGPITDKEILLLGTNGSQEKRFIKPKRMPGLFNKFYSEVDNVLWDGDSLFIGMHLERLLLTILIKDELSVDDIRRKTWTTLASLFKKQPITNLPFDGEFERIFFASSKMGSTRRKEIRKLLRS